MAVAVEQQTRPPVEVIPDQLERFMTRFYSLAQSSVQGIEAEFRAASGEELDLTKICHLVPLAQLISCREKAKAIEIEILADPDLCALVTPGPTQIRVTEYEIGNLLLKGSVRRCLEHKGHDTEAISAFTGGLFGRFYFSPPLIEYAFRLNRLQFGVSQFNTADGVHLLNDLIRNLIDSKIWPHRTDLKGGEIFKESIGDVLSNSRAGVMQTVSMANFISVQECNRPLICVDEHSWTIAAGVLPADLVAMIHQRWKENKHVTYFGDSYLMYRVKLSPNSDLLASGRRKRAQIRAFVNHRLSLKNSI